MTSARSLMREFCSKLLNKQSKTKVTDVNDSRYSLGSLDLICTSQDWNQDSPSITTARLPSEKLNGDCQIVVSSDLLADYKGPDVSITVENQRRDILNVPKPSISSFSDDQISLESEPSHAKFYLNEFRSPVPQQQADRRRTTDILLRTNPSQTPRRYNVNNRSLRQPGDAPFCPPANRTRRYSEGSSPSSSRTNIKSPRRRTQPSVRVRRVSFDSAVYLGSSYSAAVYDRKGPIVCIYTRMNNMETYKELCAYKINEMSNFIHPKSIRNLDFGLTHSRGSVRATQLKILEKLGYELHSQQ